MSNNKDGSGQTETDELDAILEELGMKVHNTAMEYRAGKLSEKELPEHQAINYAEARVKVQRYSHHQTTEARIDEARKAKDSLHLVREGKSGVEARGFDRAVKLFHRSQDDRIAKLERIKEQSLPTNKDKET